MDINKGDDDQAIFRWAGADVNSFIAQTGKFLKLTESHRVPRIVHDVAMKIVKRISKRHYKEVKLNDGIEWFNSIPNPFSESRIKLAIEDVFSAEKARKNMESFTKKIAQEKASKFLNTEKDDVVVVLKNRTKGCTTYIKRAVTDILYYYDKYGEVPSVVAKSSKCVVKNCKTVVKT